MTKLLPHQQDLLRRLSAGESRRTLVISPPGFGLTQVLVHLAERGARSNERVLVMTPHRVLVEQWADRLGKLDCPSKPLFRETDLIDASGGPHDARILIASTAMLHRPLFMQSLVSIRPDLLILDAVRSTSGDKTSNALAALSSSAREVVVSSHVSSDPPWLGHHEVISWAPDLPETDQLRERRLVLQTYPVSVAEQTTYRQALNLLREATGRDVLPGSRPALLSQILRAASHLSDDLGTSASKLATDDRSEALPLSARRSGLDRDLWAVADALEALGTDNRSNLVTTIVLAARENGRRCLVTTDTVEEASYVSEALNDLGLSNVIITGRVPRSEAMAAIEAWTAETPLVATTVVAESHVEIPDEATVVWWTPPITADSFERRFAIGWTSSAETIVPISDPPLPRDDQFASQVVPVINPSRVVRLRVILSGDSDR